MRILAIFLAVTSVDSFSRSFRHQHAARNSLIWGSRPSFSLFSRPRKDRHSLSSSNATTTAEGEDSNKQTVPALPSRRTTKRRRRKIDLMWCNTEHCKEVVRERVVGEHNQVILNGPATGQVAYYWTEDAPQLPSIANGKVDPEAAAPATCSVLLLVKLGDEELIRTAAEAVQQLSANKMHILLEPTVAARLEHYYGVDGQNIRLFEPRPTSGFGECVSEADIEESENMSNINGVHRMGDGHYFPDIICTLGGDGLLMHAAMLFQGPVPPILPVSGGSMGFLTPFRPVEMVDAIRIALGTMCCKTREDEGCKPPAAYNGIDVYPPNMPQYPYDPLETPYDDIFGDDLNGEHSHDLARSNFAFGWSDRICLSIRMRLECRVLNRDGSIRARYNVLNEVCVDRGSSPYLAALECFCDNAHLTTVQADGVIFATPTGSTAYSLAAGSSVVHPAVPCILVTPICPHVLSFRSMVFPDHVVLRCYVPDDARAEASVAFDGKHRQTLRRGDSVQIQMSPYPVPTINRVDHSADWLSSLKRNFNFNARPRQRPL